MQLAAPPSATAATLTEGAGVAGIVITAGSAFPGVQGNRIQVVCTSGGSLTVTSSLISTGVLISIQTNGGASTVNQVVTAFNAAIPTNVAVASALSGGTGNLATFSQTALAGGASGVPVIILTSVNVTAGGTGKQSVTIQIQDASTGAAIDIAANAGNLVNLELFLKDAVA